MRRVIEPGAGLRAGFAALPRALNRNTVVTAAVAILFSIAGPALIYVSVAEQLGFTAAQTSSWLFGAYAVAGLIGIVLAPYYQMPIVGAACIPGASLLATALAGHSFAEAVGAYVASGALVLLIGISGLASRVMALVPLPIVMGMVAGCMMNFGTGIVSGTSAMPLVCGAAVIGYFALPRVLKKVPPVPASLLCALLALLLTGGFETANLSFSFSAPLFTLPRFSPGTLLSVSVPLAVLVVGAQNAQAIGVLRAQGYTPPVGAMTVASGVASMAAGLFGGHNANIAGPMTAICASGDADPDPAKRFGAAFACGVFSILFGVFSGVALGLISAIPVPVTTVLAGLAMISVLVSSLTEAFGSATHLRGAFVALVVGLSGVTLLGVGAAFWALVFGSAASLLSGEGKSPLEAGKRL
ncbi:MAG: hypothetical protein ABT01_03320 [Clostridium sp. SCN 57-10]|nr:MAG: hypothetical protein ABT01_03320 [Clostridium sp. SCN 57-10]